VKELETLTDDTKYDPVIDKNIFPIAHASVYWSSTTLAGGPSFAWSVGFIYGVVGGYSKASVHNVRCVRGGQSGDSINPPSNLMAKATSSSAIVLSWKDNATNETGFKIERKAGACGSANPWSQLASVGANVMSYTDSTLTANSTYSYRVLAYNAAGSSVYAACASDMTALSGTPNAPTNLTATAVSASNITLGWTDNAANETGVEIWRKAGAGAWGLLSTTAANAVSYSDATATGNSTATTYSYYLRACNAAGCSRMTSWAVVPFRPINLTAAALTGAIDLAWTDKSANETGMKVRRKEAACSGAGTFTLLATKGANVTTHRDTGLTSGTTHAYKVRAYIRSAAMPYAYGYSLLSDCDDAVVP